VFTLFTVWPGWEILPLMQTKITILLADDHTVVRQGIRALLTAERDFQVVGEVSTGRQAVTAARELQPNVVVMDIAMPYLNGLEATRQISMEAPASKVLVLSTYSDDQYVQQLIEAGAIGYLVKQTAATDLVRAIREAQQGNSFFTPSIAKRLRDQWRDTFANEQPANKPEEVLTARETEVLQLIAEGRPNKQIAAELCISAKTVEKHRQTLKSKLNIHHIAGLTQHAIARGMIECSFGLKPGV
jgi:DNA-binding NarL/FixJ family response regulator